MSSKDKFESRNSIAPIGVRKNGQPVKVVVIDDEFVDRRIMTQILRSSGFDVAGEAEDGQAGLVLIHNEQPQLVILDYMMPQMNGLTALKEIKKRFPGVQVVMQTSETEKTLAIKLIKEGAIDYIVKPLNRPLILQKLQKVVDEINKASYTQQ